MTIAEQLQAAPLDSGEGRWRSAIHQAFGEIAMDVLAPTSALSFADWCLRRLRLEAGQSVDYSGMPLDVTLVPHTGIIDDFLNDPFAWELNIMKSSQSSFTTTVIAAMARRLDDEPKNVIYMIGNLQEAETISKKDIQPFLRQVFGRVHGTTLHLQPNGVNFWLGSATEGFMRNKPAWCIIEDESDTMEDTLTGGSQDLETAQNERLKAAKHTKIIRLCTPLQAYDPTLPKDVPQPGTRIHRNYLRGDQREYQCPCPHCSRMGPLLPEHIQVPRLDDGEIDVTKIENAVWKCPDCGGEVPDNGDEKKAMVRAGKWVPTNPKASRRVWSARQTDMVALIGKASWGFLAEKIEDAKKTGKLAAVMRAFFAEPENVSNEALSRSEKTILKHANGYPRGKCPSSAPYVIGIAVDVQDGGKYFPWVIGDISMEGALHVIDWGEADSFEELDAIRRRPIPLTEPTKRADGSPVTHVYVTRAVIDSGNHAKGGAAPGAVADDSVYMFCARSAKAGRFMWTALKGAGGQQTKTWNGITKDSRAWINATTPIPLVLFDDWAYKRQLYSIRLSDPEKPHPEKATTPIIRFPAPAATAEPRKSSPDDRNQPTGREVDYDNFVKQMVAERLVQVRKRTRTGKVVYPWEWQVPANQHNDFGDCVKMLLVIHTLFLRTSGQTGQGSG